MNLKTIIELMPVMLQLVGPCLNSENRGAFLAELEDEESCCRLLEVGCRMARRSQGGRMGGQPAGALAELEAAIDAYRGPE